MPEKMTMEVLISCMHQKDFSVAENTNIQSDALMINQCDEDSVLESEVNGYSVRMLNTTERGLSRSRNMAIQNMRSEIGLIADDDEHLNDDYEKVIAAAYARIPDADIICFRMTNQPSRLKQMEQCLNQWNVLRIASWQISFRRESIQKKGLQFDPYLGAGSGNGAGEEVKFLRDCIKAGLKVYYVPEDIGTVGNDYYETGNGENSSWFEGFDEKFFYQRGLSTRYSFGFWMSLFYAFYYVKVKKSMYEKNITPMNALKATLKGIFNNDIEKQKRKEAGL